MPRRASAPWVPSIVRLAFSLVLTGLWGCMNPSAGQLPPPYDTSGGVDDTYGLCYGVSVGRHHCVPPSPPGLVQAYPGAPGESLADPVTCWTLSRAAAVDGIAVLSVGMEHGAVELAGVVGEGRVPAEWHAPAIIKDGSTFRFVGRWGGEHRLQRIELTRDRLVLSAPVPWFALTAAGAEAFAIRARQTDVFASPAALRTRVAVRTLPRLGPPIGTDGATLLSNSGALRYDPATGVPTVRRRLENVRASPFALHGHDGRIYGLYDVDMWSTYGQRIAVHDDASGTMLYNVAFEPGFLLPGVGELSLAGLWCE